MTLWRVLALAAGTVLLCSVAPHTQRISAPGLVLWAWERPEDLRFIDPSTTGVAYLAATATIRQDGAVAFHFRQQPLATPAGAIRIAVVRIESPARYVFPDPSRLVEGLRAAAEQRDVRALQIDFDARASERRFYRSVLEELRRTTTLPIGITALATWCEGDKWIDPSVVSEAVPMFFRMGRGESKAMAIEAPVCRGAAGVSLDESWPPHPSGRLYVFNPRSWTQADYDSVLRKRDIR
jgi:hypothetical protein